MVADVREHFDECDTDVRHMPFTPLGNEQSKAVENQLTKTGVVLRQVIDLRFVVKFRRTDIFIFAVELGRAIDFEAERRAGVPWIETGQRFIGSAAVILYLIQTQPVTRKITTLIQSHAQTILMIGIGPIMRFYAQHLEISDA